MCTLESIRSPCNSHYRSSIPISEIILESYMHIRNNCFNLWDGSSLDLRSKACWLQPKPEPLCPGFPHPAKHKIQTIREEAIQNPQDVDNKKLGLLLTVTRIWLKQLSTILNNMQLFWTKSTTNHYTFLYPDQKYSLMARCRYQIFFKSSQFLYHKQLDEFTVTPWPNYYP